MVQVTAAALVAECRTLCTAASVQSIPTDANQEDVVPMGMAAAFKARRILANARRVVATELLCAAQGGGRLNQYPSINTAFTAKTQRTQRNSLPENH